MNMYAKIYQKRKKEIDIVKNVEELILQELGLILNVYVDPDGQLKGPGVDKTLQAKFEKMFETIINRDYPELSFGVPENFDFVTPDWIANKIAENDIYKNELARGVGVESPQITHWLKGIGLSTPSKAAIYYFFKCL